MSEPASHTPEELKAAFKAFKKRLKFTRLEDQSRLGGGPLTGRRGDIVAIGPPSEYPKSVWEELVRQGKLRYMGNGTYGLAET